MRFPRNAKEATCFSPENILDILFIFIMIKTIIIKKAVSAGLGWDFPFFEIMYILVSLK